MFWAPIIEPWFKSTKIAANTPKFRFWIYDFIIESVKSGERYLISSFLCFWIFCRKENQNCNHWRLRIKNIAIKNNSINVMVVHMSSPKWTPHENGTTRDWFKDPKWIRKLSKQCDTAWKWENQEIKNVVMVFIFIYFVRNRFLFNFKEAGAPYGSGAQEFLLEFLFFIVWQLMITSLFLLNFLRGYPL